MRLSFFVSCLAERIIDEGIFNMKCTCVVSGLLMFLCVTAAEPGVVAAVSQTLSSEQLNDEMDDIYESIPELAELLHDASRMAEDALLCGRHGNKSG